MAEQQGTRMIMSEQAPDLSSDTEHPARSDRHQRRRRQGNRGGVSGRLEHRSINMGELRELLDLVAQHDLAEFELSRESFRVRLRRSGPEPAGPSETLTARAASQDALARQPSEEVLRAGGRETNAQPREEASTREDLHMITSPIVGTFYRSPSPSAEPFVRLGSHIEKETVVCIIEAMKLMNEVPAETTGDIAKIYVENGQPVEFGQPLFGVTRSA